jgi:1,2-phenylacetyl-CoA epoxidase catalytic subunit
MEKILKEFQKFYRRHSEMWLERYAYKESAQHLLLMAFLQRIINAGGEIVREMALGNERIDLLVRYKKQEFALELKIRWRDYSIEDGKEQLARYLDKVGLEEGYLVIYETREKSWDEKIYWQEIKYKNKKLILVGL